MGNGIIDQGLRSTNFLYWFARAGQNGMRELEAGNYGRAALEFATVSPAVYLARQVVDGIGGIGAILERGGRAVASGNAGDLAELFGQLTPAIIALVVGTGPAVRGMLGGRGVAVADVAAAVDDSAAAIEGTLGGDVAAVASTETGANVVYRSVDAAGRVNYVGITNSLARRAAEHLRTKGIQIERVMGGLSRGDARAVEQALIEIHRLGRNGGTLLNRINSISPNNPAYAAQLQRGYDLLRSIGY